MALSRLRRYEDQRQQKRLLLAIAGSVGLLLFLLIFGVKLLIGFSLMVDGLRGNTPQTTSQAIVLPPVLDPLPEATNSATFIVSGKGTPKLTLILYVNDAEAKRMPVPENGTFTINDATGKDGQNTTSAKLLDAKGNISELSNVVMTLVKKSKPVLEISSPSDNATVKGDKKEVTVIGKTEEDTTVTVNGRFVVTRTDGSFTFTAPINDGDTTLKIVATDQAGNQTTVERHVTYRP